MVPTVVFSADAAELLGSVSALCVLRLTCRVGPLEPQGRRVPSSLVQWISFLATASGPGRPVSVWNSIVERVPWSPLVGTAETTRGLVDRVIR